MKSTLFAAWVMISVAIAVLFVSGPALAWGRIVPPQVGFLMCVGASLLGVIGTIVGLIAILRGHGGSMVAVWFLSAVPAGFLVFSMAGGYKYPLINDISTEAVNPPAFAHVSTLPETEGWDMTFPAMNEALIAEAYPEIKPLPIRGTLDDVYAKAHQIAKLQPGWTILSTKLGDKEHVIEGYSESSVFRFRDYFVVRIRAIEDEVVVVDMRSKSKDGKGDFGVNAERIRAYLEKLRS